MGSNRSPARKKSVPFAEELAAEPGRGEAGFAADRGHGETHGLGSLLDAETREVAQFEHARLPLVVLRQRWTGAMGGIGADVSPRALRFWERLVGPDHYEIAVLLNNLAGVCAATARPDEAEELYRRAIVIKRRLLGADHPELALTLTNLATLMRERDRFEEGRALATEAQRILQGSSLPEEHPLRVYATEVLRDLA